MCFCVCSLVCYKSTALLLFGDTAQGCCLLPAFLTCTGRWGGLNRELWEWGPCKSLSPHISDLHFSRSLSFLIPPCSTIELGNPHNASKPGGTHSQLYPYKLHLTFLFLRCFGHALHQINGLPLSWGESIASIHPGFCNAFQSGSSSKLVASASHITGSQGFCLC